MKAIQRYSNEKGFALILALSMLAILSILGVFALNTSTTEVQISGNYSAAQQAFFAADRIIAMVEADVLDGPLQNMNLDEIRLLDDVDDKYLDRHGNSGLVPGTSTIRLVHEDEIYSMNHYVINLIGGVFSSEASTEPRQRVRIETKIATRNVVFGTAGVGGAGVGQTTYDLQTTD